MYILYRKIVFDGGKTNYFHWYNTFLFLPNNSIKINPDYPV